MCRIEESLDFRRFWRPSFICFVLKQMRSNAGQWSSWALSTKQEYTTTLACQSFCSDVSPWGNPLTSAVSKGRLPSLFVRFWSKCGPFLDSELPERALSRVEPCIIEYSFFNNANMSKWLNDHYVAMSNALASAVFEGRLYLLRFEANAAQCWTVKFLSAL